MQDPLPPPPEPAPEPKVAPKPEPINYNTAKLRSTGGKRMRKEFSEEEDMKIYEYAEKHEHKKMMGNVVWRQAQLDKLTAHSWQSMRTRYKKLAAGRLRVQGQAKPALSVVPIRMEEAAPAKGESKKPFEVVEREEADEETEGGETETEEEGGQESVKEGDEEGADEDDDVQEGEEDQIPDHVPVLGRLPPLVVDGSQPLKEQIQGMVQQISREAGVPKLAVLDALYKCSMNTDICRHYLMQERLTPEQRAFLRKFYFYKIQDELFLRCAAAGKTTPAETEVLEKMSEFHQGMFSERFKFLLSGNKTLE